MKDKKYRANTNKKSKGHTIWRRTEIKRRNNEEEYRKKVNKKIHTQHNIISPLLMRLSALVASSLLQTGIIDG